VTWVTCFTKLVLCGCVGIVLLSERLGAGDHDGAAARRRRPRIFASSFSRRSAANDVVQTSGKVQGDRRVTTAAVLVPAERRSPSK
jgi:hypothetical protein